MKPLVYFNKNFSVTSAQLEAIRAGGHFRTLASHTDPTHAMIASADEAITEPKGFGGQRYLAWLLEACQRHGVAVLIVGKEREYLADFEADFARVGTHLVAPAPRQTQRLLEDKDRFLESLPKEILPIPAWRRFHDLESFQRGVAELRGDSSFKLGRSRLCVKPARGVYASGFRVLMEHPSLRSFLSGELYQMSYGEAERLFDSDALPTMLLMHTLEGVERSIDAVAWRGELAACVVRRKGAGGQLIEDRPDLVVAAQQLTQHYGLSGIFNVQTKDDDDRRANLLEINPRASGGLRYSMAAGVNFPEIAARLALGQLEPSEVAGPHTGLRLEERKTVRIVSPTTGQRLEVSA